MSHSRIPVEQVLDGLKDFQRRSVDYVFRRLYEDKEPAKRFLIADEVGLGKTLVARGLIAKAVNHLWDQGVDRVDVIYICSNANIARQNINRLKIPKQDGFSHASRITLLPVTLRDPGDKLNFVSFTPGTSFDLRSSSGVMRERALLYDILRRAWGFGNIAGPINLLQCGAGKDSWRSYLKHFRDWNEIDENLAQAFVKELQDHIQKSHLTGETDVRTRFEELVGRFSHYRKHVPWRDRRTRDELIGELRFIMAVSCVKALEPDLIILDEFQRFKHLLDRQNPVGKLAHQLFDYQDKRVADHEAKVILLSATPYKMYTMYHEAGQDDHYEDFIDTVQFLFDSEEKTRSFRELLRAYRLELYRLGNHDDESLHRLEQTRDRIEESLRSVMTRTERLAITVDRNGMIVEPRDDRGQLQPQDLAAFKTVDGVAQALEAGDHVEYWKSAPYLLNIMDNYVLKRKLKAVESGTAYPQLVECIRQGMNTMLSRQAIGNYQQIDPANAKLRTLIEQALEPGGWKLLWIPPSLPYYQPRGVYAEVDDDKMTKRLVFSAWKVAPKAISMLCSYEAERQMVSGYAHREGVDYRDLRHRRRPLLHFRLQDNRLTGMSVFTLLYPCLTLAQQIDPLVDGVRLASDGRPPSCEVVYAAIRRRIESLLEQIEVESSRRTGTPDQRWYWAAPMLLDRHFNPAPVTRWLGEQNETLAWQHMVRRRPDEEDTHFSEHVAQLRVALHNPEELELGPRPDDLGDVLAKIALASPAVVTLRAFCRQRKDIEETSTWQVLSAAARAAMGFRTLFNLPESITLIRSPNDSEDVKRESSGSAKPYWERALDYAVDGNLQAVMDEYVHVLYEALGARNSTPEKAAQSLADAIQDAVSLRTISLSFDEIQLKGNDIVRPGPGSAYGMRCRYALSFGQGRNYDDKDVTRAEQVRTAFNSPFRPFILATTSIGQEGLDFHQYCHAIYHWNLPSNPVDLEQREGRIHRYKGHVIRKNLAEHYGLSALVEEIQPLSDPWAYLFCRARKERLEDSDLIPYWIYEKGKSKIERHVPALPLSREREQLENLKKDLVVYRMVFGQPRQEDLLGFLQSRLSGDVSIEDILKYRIDLTPR